MAKKDALAAEPPQDARCTFCVNIWNDFEIMIAISSVQEMRAGYRRCWAAAVRGERAAERKKRYKRRRRMREGGEDRNEEEKRK